MKISFNELFSGMIMGIIDSYGCVHSNFLSIEQRSDHDIYHNEQYPGQIFKRWRWTYNSGLTVSALSSDFDIEDGDKVRRHIERKYKIKFWENGYHNIDYFMKQMEWEKSNE